MLNAMPGGREPIVMPVRIYVAIYVLILLSCGKFSGTAPAAFEWHEAAPETQGVSSAALADAVTFAREHLALHSLLIVRHGRIVLDAAFYPFTPGARHDFASVTKSVTSLLVGAAEQAGRLRRTDRLDSLLTPESPVSDRRHEAVTVADLLGMQSGLDCGFREGEPELAAMTRSTNWIRAALELSMAAAPGTRTAYCSVNYHLLSAIISRTTGESELAFARHRLFGPLGIDDVYWPADPQGLTHGWGDLQLTSRDAARIGLLMLHHGMWDGREVVSREWVAWTTAPHGMLDPDDVYGRGWWTHPHAPPGLFEAVGRGGQRITVWPAKDLVIVETAGGAEPGKLAPFLLRAVASDTALTPDSAALARLHAALAQAIAPPPAHQVSVPPFARHVWGRRYRLSPNAIAMHRFSVNFDSASATARATLDLLGHRLTLPVGLDGRYRFSRDSVEGVHPAARGSWTSPGTFVLDLNLVGKINRYAMSFRFSHNGARVAVHVTEATGTVTADARGTRLP
jgi:CubicO group peptidase (beta-lactamase class C family)